MGNTFEQLESFFWTGSREHIPHKKLIRGYQRTKGENFTQTNTEIYSELYR
jgi:hypothetical protein